MKPSTPSNGLSVRANRCFAKAGISVEKEAVARLLQNGTISPYLWPPGYGKKMHTEVCHWTGIDPQTLRLARSDGPITIYPNIGLSYRAWNCLRRAGIPTTKEAVRQAVANGALYPGKRPGSYGKVTHAEICDWVGLDESGKPPAGNKQRGI